VPAPAESTPRPAVSQSSSDHAAQISPSPEAHRPAGRRGRKQQDALPAPARPARSSSANGASGGAESQHRHSRPSANSSTVAPTRSKDTGTRTSEPAAARSSTSAPRGHVDVRTPSTYRVRPGDSLWGIAARHLGPKATTSDTAREVNRLWELNQQRIGTGNPDLIFPGQTLTM
jgi:resuscitation-promoting factor RpfA